jgi:NuA3 HAT complex component NTO1
MKNLQDEDDGAVNTGSNLFVTGIAPSLTESALSALFERYGEVDNCSIMLDPHTKESRGFGFVKMNTGEQADAAKEALQGETHDGRTLSIEKARRARPRTPTPGKYFGPPKRGTFSASFFFHLKPSANPSGDHRGPPRGGYRDRYDDRRGGYGGYGRRDDRGAPRYNDYDDRRGGYRRDRDDGYGGGGRGGIDRYEGGRRGGDDYYSGGRDGGYSGAPRGDYGAPRERRGGGYGGGYDREDRGYGGGAPRDAPRDAAPRDDTYSGRDYPREDRGYSSR